MGTAPSGRSDELQRLENVLRDTSASAVTRGWLLRRAAAGSAVVGLVGLAAACGGSSGSGSSAATMPVSTTDMAGDTITSVINTAITAEALAVTYLTAVIENAKGTPVEPLVDVLKAANAAEYDHYNVLKSLGASPLTLKFWAPDDFFGPKLANVFPTIEVAEGLFVDAYLIGTTVFANSGKPDLARYAGEIGSVEAEHLALARFAQKKLPNNIAFTGYPITTMSGIVKALEGVGVGFGKKGSKPGKFVTFSPPPKRTLVSLEGTSPQ
jgi:hypothetical protein